MEMGGGVADEALDRVGFALAAGLLALIAPQIAWTMLACGAGALVMQGRSTGYRPDGTIALGLAAMALGGALWGAPGLVAAALAWRALFEIGAVAESRGLTEPPWMAFAYRWAPVIAALLFRLGAPTPLVLAAAGLAALAATDWALRRLAEWRLGQPQPFDTSAYMASQSRVLLFILAFPAPEAALAAFLAFALARGAEIRLRTRYVAAL
jgi:hypothetical protein